uniref:Ig-like domain-containing protein n=1 Tax=Pundamilia nyererei TaxID=303518 RepID=A0A3B4FYW8_9CICH
HISLFIYLFIHIFVQFSTYKNLSLTAFFHILFSGCTDDLFFETKSLVVGDYVTLKCPRQVAEYKETMYWIRIVSGSSAEFLGGTFTFDYNGVNKTPHITAKQEPGTFTLDISKVNLSDIGLYYCIKVRQLAMTFLKGTFLTIKELEPDANYTVVQEKTVHAGNSVTLHCSLFSDAENKTCPGGHHVFWFREASHPDIIYTEGNRHHECEKRSEAQRSCVFRSSKNVSSSNAATYYCAVATCGLILFGNGTKQEMVQTAGSAFIALVIAIICLVISLILNVIFICCRTPGAACEQIKSELNYAALQFSGRKTTRGKKKKDELETEESVYSQVKCRM